MSHDIEHQVPLLERPKDVIVEDRTLQLTAHRPNPAEPARGHLLVELIDGLGHRQIPVDTPDDGIGMTRALRFLLLLHRLGHELLGRRDVHELLHVPLR